MKKKKNTKKTNRRRLGILLALLLFVIAAGVVAWQLSQPSGAGKQGQRIDRTSQGSAAAPLAPGNVHPVGLLTKDYWVIEHWLAPQNGQEAYRRNKGRWYQFNPDGTFISGWWDDQTARGSWFLTTVAGKQYIRLDSVNDAEDSEFDIQGINGAGNAMSWVGTETYGQQGVMVKIMSLMSIPTRAQFGIEPPEEDS